MVRRAPRALSGLLVALVIVAGCSSAGTHASAGGGGINGGGGSPSAAPSPAVRDPGSPPTLGSCEILSDQEIAAATGHGVQTRTPSTLTQVFPSVCDIALDGAQLVVSVLSPGGRSMYEDSFEPFIGQEGILDEAVPGLGDKAARTGDGTLVVLAGDTLFDLQYLEFGRQDRQSVLRYLAEIILAKLPCLAAGCPGFTPPPPPVAAEGADVCALLTPQEVEQATGFAVTRTEPGASTCRWALETPSMTGLDGVELTLLGSGGRAKFDYWANDFFEVAPEHVPGLGDDAIKTGTIPAGAVHVVVGDRLLTLDFLLPLTTPDPYAMVVSLAEFAVPRLP